MNLNTLLIVALGGAFGACSRFTIGYFSIQLLGKAFPYGTLIVNILGSFIMGVVYSWLMNHSSLDSWIKPLVMVGFLGSLTTFSTFSLDTLMLLESGDIAKAMLNVFVNVVICIGVAYIGTLLIKS